MQIIALNTFLKKSAVNCTVNCNIVLDTTQPGHEDERRIFQSFMSVNSGRTVIGHDVVKAIYIM